MKYILVYTDLLHNLHDLGQNCLAVGSEGQTALRKAGILHSLAKSSQIGVAVAEILITLSPIPNKPLFSRVCIVEDKTKTKNKMSHQKDNFGIVLE